MTLVFNLFVGFAVAAVVLVLIAGFYNMFRRGDANRSQILMRWRVGLQFVALIVAMIVIYAKGR
jgi:hypothetical protein